MVLLGHSMGGPAQPRDGRRQRRQVLAAQLRPPVRRRSSATADALDELQRYLFFEPLPFVQRVVFLATPHRGSDLSRSMVGRVGAGLITEPDHIADLLSQADQGQPRRLRPPQFRRLPTSIETLDTDSPILLALLAMQPGPGVVVPLDHRLDPARRRRHDDRRRRPLPQRAPRRRSSRSCSSGPTTASRSRTTRSARSSGSCSKHIGFVRTQTAAAAAAPARSPPPLPSSRADADRVAAPITIEGIARPLPGR